MSSASPRATSSDSLSRRSIPDFDDQPVDDHVDVVVPPPIQLDLIVNRAELSVDARLGEAARAKSLQFLLELALPAADDGRQDVDARILRIEHHQIDDALERLRRDLRPQL